MFKVVFVENKYMKLAINEALLAIEEGEMPVGAVIVQNEKVIATAHNIRNTQHDPTLTRDMKKKDHLQIRGLSTHKRQVLRHSLLRDLDTNPIQMHR